MFERECRKGFRFAFEELSPRRRRMYCRRLMIVAALIAAVVSVGCLKSIDKECNMELETLPEKAYSAAAPAVPIEPEYLLYDIPLSEELQRFTYERCLEWDVDPVMVYAIIQTESNYQPDLISDTGDYGLMQINGGNMDYLMDSLGITNILNNEQNIEAGIFWLWGIRQNCTDPNAVLMVYNLGGVAARERMEAGQESTWYSRKVLRTMDEIRERRVEI